MSMYRTGGNTLGATPEPPEGMDRTPEMARIVPDGRIDLVAHAGPVDGAGADEKFAVWTPIKHLAACARNDFGLGSSK